MADSPRSGESPGESLVKKEPDIPAEDPIVSRSSSGWMLVSALADDDFNRVGALRRSVWSAPVEGNAAGVCRSLHTLSRQH